MKKLFILGLLLCSFCIVLAASALAITNANCTGQTNGTVCNDSIDCTNTECWSESCTTVSCDPPSTSCEADTGTCGNLSATQCYCEVVGEEPTECTQENVDLVCGGGGRDTFCYYCNTYGQCAFRSNLDCTVGGQPCPTKYCDNDGFCGGPGVGDQGHIQCLQVDCVDGQNDGKCAGAWNDCWCDVPDVCEPSTTAACDQTCLDTFPFDAAFYLNGWCGCYTSTPPLPPTGPGQTSWWDGPVDLLCDGPNVHTDPNCKLYCGYRASDSEIPEFSTYGIVIAVLAVLGVSFYMMKKKKQKK